MMEKKDLLLVSSSDITSTYLMIEADFIRQLIGYPGATITPLKIREGFHVFTAYGDLLRLDDVQLSAAASRLDNLIVEFYRLDEQMALWLFNNVGLNKKMAESQNERFPFAGMEDLVKKREVLVLPTWVEHPDYIALINQSAHVVRQIFDLVKQIIARIGFQREDISDPLMESYEQRTRTNIKYMDSIMDQGIRIALPKIAEEMENPTVRQDWRLFDFDERINDLVDVAVELYPKPAIKKLKQALSLNPQGFQAIKVYVELGQRYEQIGEGEKAIDCYTKAMDKTELLASILFLRGKVHFELGHYREAKLDFEQAFAWDEKSHNSELTSRDRSEIDKLLGELKNKGC